MNIGVIGAGTMGNGIAHSFGFNGYDVLLHDVSNQMLSKGLDTIKINLDRMLKKEKINEIELSQTLKNISATTSLDQMNDRDIIIEAATESLDIKISLLINFILL